MLVYSLLPPGQLFFPPLLDDVSCSHCLDEPQWMLWGMRQIFHRNHLVELSSYPHQTVLQLDQTERIWKTKVVHLHQNEWIQWFTQVYISINVKEINLWHSSRAHSNQNMGSSKGPTGSSNWNSSQNAISHHSNNSLELYLQPSVCESHGHNFCHVSFEFLLAVTEIF